MKKLIALMIAAMMLATAVLAGCGETEGSSTASDASSSSQAETEAAKQTLTIDNKAGFVMTMEYPDTLTYNPDSTALNDLFGQKKETNFGALEGDYTFAFQTEHLYENAYETFEDYVKQFKSADIYEEKKLGDYDAYIAHRDEGPIYLYIVIEGTEFLEGALKKDGASADDYQKIYEGDFTEMVNSIKFEGGSDSGSSAASGEAITTEEGYLTVTPVDGWYLGESKANDAPTLYNDKIGPVSWIIFDDSQLTTADKLKEYVLAGYGDYAFEPITIGNNDYEILTAGTDKDVSFLVAPTSSGKGLEIELRNVTVDDAKSLLETVVIK